MDHSYRQVSDDDIKKVITILALTKVAFAAQPSKVLIASGWVTGVGNGITDTKSLICLTKPMFVILMTTH